MRKVEKANLKGFTSEPGIKSLEKKDIEQLPKNSSQSDVQFQSNVKHLIVTQAANGVIPGWVAEVLLKWGGLQDA